MIFCPPECRRSFKDALDGLDDVPEDDPEVGAVAVRWVSGALTGTQQERLVLLGREANRSDVWSFCPVSAVAERLLLAVSTGAPGVAFTCRHLHSAGQPGGGDGLRGLQAALDHR